MMTWDYSFDEIETTAARILESYPHAKCIAFFAEMGSGKTTLISALCKALGSIDTPNSPTFSIINEYKLSGSGQSIFHMDWYRLKNTEDAIETGVQDILTNTDAYCFIEWPEIAEDLLPANCLKIELLLLTENTRRIIIS